MFNLFDKVITLESCVRDAPTRKRPRILPRIHVFGADPRVAALWTRYRPQIPASDGTARIKRLVRRLQAIKSALDDLPSQPGGSLGGACGSLWNRAANINPPSAPARHPATAEKKSTKSTKSLPNATAWRGMR